VRRPLIVAVLGLGLGLAACGGGVSKADFVAKADQACAPGNAAVASLAKPSNLPDLAAGAGTLATTVDGQVAELRKLEAPEDDKVLVDGMLAALAEVGGAARTLQETAGKTDDAATAKAANDLKAKTDTAAAQTEAYGFGACGRALREPVTTLFQGGNAVVKAAFVAKADALCTAATRKVAALANPTSLATLARYLASYVPIEEKLFADIKALPVPPGDEGTVADMLTAQSAVTAKDKEALAAAQARNQRLLDAVDEESASLITAANAKFDTYGLKNCGTLGAF
jgi:hypothetical protein